MGADLLVSVLWSDGKPLSADKGIAAVREVLFVETDLEILNAAAEFVGLKGLDDLTAAVLLADEDARISYCEKILSGYKETIETFIDRLNSRQVNQIHFGDCIGYVTGGMSWGDSPTDVFEEWEQLFYNDEESGGSWNPYKNTLYKSFFIAPNKQWAMAGDVTVDKVVLTVK